MVLIGCRVRFFVLAIFILFFASTLQAQIVSHNFRKADSVAALYPGHSLQNLKALADKLTTPLNTEQEKFRAIYFWISHNIANDYSYYMRNKKMREKWRDNPEALKEWNRKFATQVFNKLLKEHKTVCTGYAYLLRELAYHAGLTAVIVDGYGRTAQSNIGGPGYVNHSWNAIQIDNQWYLCDATWSSGAINLQEGSFVKKFDDAYFMANPSLFVLNHYPLDSTWMLLDTKPTLAAFLNGPLIYSSIHQYQVYPRLPDTFNKAIEKNQSIVFCLGKDSTISSKKVDLQINGLTVSSKVSQDNSDQLCMEYTFRGKGKYVVHIVVDGQHVISHQVIAK